MIQITLDQIKALYPCSKGLDALAAAFPGQEIFDFEAVAKTLHFDYVMWGLRVLTVDQCHQITVPFAKFCAEHGALYNITQDDTAWVAKTVVRVVDCAARANAVCAALVTAQIATFVACAAHAAYDEARNIQRAELLRLICEYSPLAGGTRS